MIKYDLSKITTVIFDVDGVLSENTIPMDLNGNPIRTMNVKDGYAIQLAAKQGIRLAIITGGKCDSIQYRYSKLGVNDIFMGCAVKIEMYREYCRQHNLKDEEVMFLGDDIPDYEIMKVVGCPCSPSDACQDIKDISAYVSPASGGNGFARDVLEQLLRSKGLWLSSAKAFGRGRLILASNSPRRRELLGGLDIPYEVHVIKGIDESYPDTLPAKEVAEYIASKKAEPYKEWFTNKEAFPEGITMTDDTVVVTADTVVVVDDQILGKPKDREDAHRMLRLVSGRTHQVYTGVCLLSKDKEKHLSVCTNVTFRELTDEEIYYYIDKYKPFDKAGAYGIQEWIGYIGVTRLEGSYFNVMGLPVQRINDELKPFPLTPPIKGGE